MLLFPIINPIKQWLPGKDTITNRPPYIWLIVRLHCFEFGEVHQRHSQDINVPD